MLLVEVEKCLPPTPFLPSGSQFGSMKYEHGCFQLFFFLDALAGEAALTAGAVVQQWLMGTTSKRCDQRRTYGSTNLIFLNGMCYVLIA